MHEHTLNTRLTRVALELDAITQAHFADTGKQLFNISHWDADEAYHKVISESVRIQTDGSRFDYEFSQTLPSHLLQSVATQLGLASPQTIQITPSGTSANLLALALLKQLNKCRLLIVGPCYFQVPLLAQALGFEVIHVDAWHPDVGFSTSMVPLHKRESDAIWITNPVYCFGSYYRESDCNAFIEILTAGFSMVVDECNSLNGHELCRRLSRFENFFGTYAPHKGVCINGLKFGVLATAQLEEPELNHLGDAWIGPLPRSIRTDMAHFMSQNFSDIKKKYLGLIERISNLITVATQNLPLRLHHGQGHFRVISFRNIDGSLELSSEYLKQLCYETKTSFIPMALNYGPRGLGFSFRVNILRNSPLLLESIQTLAKAIGAQHTQHKSSG